MEIFKKLFCCHKWVTHAKEVYTWVQTDLIVGTKPPQFEKQEYSEVNEILICEKCGEIKKLEY